MITKTKIKSHAKLNLSLSVVGKTSTLHKIESIIAFASLHDEIYISEIKSKTHYISFSGKFSKNITKKNTVSKLLKILEKKGLLKGKKFSIKINKKIPNKAGLGGGSMNAANILNYFLKKKIIETSKKEILNISKFIGSDVILGLKSTNSILSSNNEIKYFPQSKKFNIMIVKPNFGCSTKEIFSKVRKFSKPKLKHPSKKMFDFSYLKKMNNALEEAAFSKYTKLNSIKLFLETLSKPMFVRMTGSGSALVSYFKTKQRCDYAKKQFTKKYKNYWCITSKTI